MDLSDLHETVDGIPGPPFLESGGRLFTSYTRLADWLRTWPVVSEEEADAMLEKYSPKLRLVEKVEDEIAIEN